jgi:hypothetical protein
MGYPLQYQPANNKSSLCSKAQQRLNLQCHARKIDAYGHYTNSRNGRIVEEAV